MGEKKTRSPEDARMEGDLGMAMGEFGTG